MKVLEAEKNIGINIFCNPYEGIGGKLRTKPEDFKVNEISHHPAENPNGKFTIADVTAVNWETNLLIRELSDRLHISRQRISFGGTKDKRASTTQIMSFYNISIEKLSQVKIKNVMLSNFYRSNQPVKIGDLHGNRFDIIIRDIGNNIEMDQVQKIASYIDSNNGFPNFFGIQRFGIIRPITHIVGRYIVKGDFENAVMSYIANPIKGEDEEVYKLREELHDTYDFSKALKGYPNYLNYEKAMLNKLVVNPDDFIGALNELPRNLLTMFVYAYQSYLFNLILSERVNKDLPINQAVVGDIIFPIRMNVLDAKVILVKKSNIKKINKQISKSKAFVSGILFGSDSVFSDGEMGEIEHRIIDNEKIDPRDFIIPDMPFVSSSGLRRPILGQVKDLEYDLIDDNLNPGKKAFNIKFELRKGSYATCLLREFMKSGDIRNY